MQTTNNPQTKQQSAAQGMLNEPSLRLMLHDVYGRAKDTHFKLYQEIGNARKMASRLSLTEMVDLFFIFDQSARRIEDLRKEIDAFGRSMIQLICARWVQDSLNNGNSAEPIRGQLATGSPDVGQSVNLPKSDSPEFLELCEFFGIPADKANLIRFHWPTMTEWVSQLLADGKNVPSCLKNQKTHTEYKCKLLPKSSNPIDDVLSAMRSELGISDKH
jgi:hypothetical protein